MSNEVAYILHRSHDNHGHFAVGIMGRSILDRYLWPGLPVVLEDGSPPGFYNSEASHVSAAHGPDGHGLSGLLNGNEGGQLPCVGRNR